jgi:hypothetical protein
MTDVNKIVVGNEPQCEPAIMLDGKVITADDYQALQAENERLKNSLNNTAAALSERIDVRKIKADAVREAADELFYQGSEQHMFCYKYANKLEAE